MRVSFQNHALAAEPPERKISWLRHYATSRKVAGSRTDEVNKCLNLYNFSSSNRPWGLLSL
jgi:hypothetical protein